MNSGVVEFALARLRHHPLFSFAVAAATSAASPPLSFRNPRLNRDPVPAVAAVADVALSQSHSSALAIAPYPYVPYSCPHNYTPSLYSSNLLSPRRRSSSSSDSSIGQESAALLVREAQVDRATVCGADTASQIGESACCSEEAPSSYSPSPSASLSFSSPSPSSLSPSSSLFSLSPSLSSSSPSPSPSSLSPSSSPSPSSFSPSSSSSSSPPLPNPHHPNSSPSSSSSSSSPHLPNPHHPFPSSLSSSSSSSSSDGIRRAPARARSVAESKRRGEVLGRTSDLLRVPGIGPRNLAKLASKGIEKLAELKQLYLDKFHGDTSGKMVEYLRDSVGIIHKNHAESIAAFVKGIADEDSKAADGSPDREYPAEKKNRLTFCIEGNISVGKTTFLERITNEAIELRDLVEIVPEPVEKWQNVGPEHFNILNAFYEDPTRYAYTFQNYVFITRLMQEQETREGLKPLRLMERSVFSDRMVFVRAVHEAKMMNEMEISIYDSWFDPVVSTLPGLVPDGFIYLRASPDTCLHRLQMRKRSEEHSVTLDYLRGLHEKHEQWLFPAEGGQEVVSISQCSSEIQELLPSKLQGRVFYLEGDHIHSRIRKVPTLVLDCEASIDFAKDIEAKSEYAQQVAEFFEFVKHKKGEKKDDNVISSGLLLPQASRLLGPDGSVLCSQAFNPLHFKENLLASPARSPHFPHV